MLKKFLNLIKNHLPSKLTQIKRSRQGFTLVELIVVVGIIAFLSIIGIVTFTKSGQKSRNAKRQVDLQTIRQALVMYKADEGCYPADLSGVGSYMSDDLKDPDGTLYTYAPEDPVSPGCFSSFILTAVLEPDGDLHTVANP